MELYNVEKDITVFYVTADSFPAGITEAHEKLHSLLPSVTNRNFFGLSRPENGNIVYIAAVEELYAGEAEKMNCKTRIIKKGTYISTLLIDYPSHPEQISKIFQMLLADPRIEHDGGYCVEMYLNDTDVRCMVLLKEN